MKTILTLSILFSVSIALPVFGDLTDADLNRIRLIVKEEVKSEITTSEKRTKDYISEVKSEITASEKRMKEYISQEIKTVNAKIDGQEKQLSRNFWLIIALIALIALPQAFIAWRSRKDRALETQIENLTQEIETLKQQQIIRP